MDGQFKRRFSAIRTSNMIKENSWIKPCSKDDNKTAHVFMSSIFLLKYFKAFDQEYLYCLGAAHGFFL